MEQPILEIQKITQGKPTTDYPAVCLLYTPTGICTGSLIAPDLVLSAAHCVKDDPKAYAKNLKIKFELDGEVITRKALNVYLHPQWKGFSNEQKIMSQARSKYEPYDFTLIQLDEPISSKKVPYLQFAKENELPKEGELCEFVGYGYSNATEKDGGRKLKGFARISSVYSKSMESTITNGQLICQGDSGGPAIFNGKIVAVNSYTSSDKCNDSGTHILVRPYLISWIRDVMLNKNSQTTPNEPNVLLETPNQENRNLKFANLEVLDNAVLFEKQQSTRNISVSLGVSLFALFTIPIWLVVSKKSR